MIAASLRQALLHGNGLARRVLVLVVLFSSLITALITSIELYGAYQRDLRAIDNAFEFVGSNYLPSLANSVWNVDDVQVQSQLDALVSMPEVEYIAILEEGRVRWHAGRAASVRTKETRIPLARRGATGPQRIGEVQIVASVDRVLSRVWARLAEVLLANAVKTALVAVFLLLCFQMLVTQHMARLAGYVRGIDPETTRADRPPLQLDRPAQGRWRPDILDTVVDAINGLVASLQRARRQLVLSQAELAESEARLRLGLEAAGAGLWDWDVAGARVYLGTGCLQLLGCEASAEAAGPQQHDLAFWQSLTHPDDLDEVQRLVRAHFEDVQPGARFLAEMRLRGDDGSWRWTAWRGRVVERDAEGRALRAIGTVADIHQRKTAEEAVRALNRQLEDRVRDRTLALEHARDEAQHASQAKSEFLSRMSHELRTPMNAILGFSQLLALGEAAPKQQRWIGEIQHAGEHLLKLIDELLDLSRIEVGKLKVTLAPVPLGPLIDEALGIVQAAMPQAVPRFQRRFGTLGQATAVADALRLKQILVNLLTNALKYAPGDSPIVVSLQAAQGLDGAEGGRVRLAVTDRGLGIPPDRLDRLFRPFERLGREDTAIEGTGVGLSLSKRLAELMNCDLGVDSAPGQGSSFWIELPLAVGEQPDHAVAARVDGAAAAGGLQVLYIEDNPTNRALMDAWFSDRPQWRLALAEDGEAGLRQALVQRPDAILLDLHLPQLDGYGVLRALRADPRTAAVPVIAVTADAKPDDRAHGLASGFDGYVTKPVRFEELATLMESLAAPKRR
jgi:PAS domain S-box-containing protein